MASRLAGTSARGVMLLTDAMTLWTSSAAFQHAGALAFYTLSSMAPLLIILIAIIGVVFGEEAARGGIAARLTELGRSGGLANGAERRAQLAD